MSIRLDSNQLTSWTDYPRRFKFISVAFEVDPHILQTDRSTYDLMELFSDIGGAIEFLKVGFGFFALKFSQLRMQAFITNRLFQKTFDTIKETELMAKSSKQSSLTSDPAVWAAP